MTISKLLKEKTPFAVMQYFESLKALKSQTNKAYELIYVNDKKKLGYKLLTEREKFLREPALANYLEGGFDYELDKPNLRLSGICGLSVTFISRTNVVLICEIQRKMG